MDLTRWPSVIVAAFVIVVVAPSLRDLVRDLRSRRNHRHLDRTGRTAAGQITAVEPLSWSVNDAAGHPVTVRFRDDRRHQREIRDISGLGGYVAREGTPVTVRFSPTDPGRVRVEEIIGRDRRYPTHPDARTDHPYLMRHPLGPFLVVVLFAGAMLALVTGDRVLMPMSIGLVGFAAVVSAGFRAIQMVCVRHRPVADAVIVDVKQHRRLPTEFSVHFVTNDGREVHTRYSGADRILFPKPGKRVRVRYLPGRPAVFEVLGHLRIPSLVVLAGLGTAFLLTGMAWAPTW